LTRKAKAEIARVNKRKRKTLARGLFMSDLKVRPPEETHRERKSKTPPFARGAKDGAPAKATTKAKAKAKDKGKGKGNSNDKGKGNSNDKGKGNSNDKGNSNGKADPSPPSAKGAAGFPSAAPQGTFASLSASRRDDSVRVANWAGRRE
jgi:hypothetical protein